MLLELPLAEGRHSWVLAVQLLGTSCSIVVCGQLSASTKGLPSSCQRMWTLHFFLMYLFMSFFRDVGVQSADEGVAQLGVGKGACLGGVGLRPQEAKAGGVLFNRLGELLLPSNRNAAARVEAPRCLPPPPKFCSKMSKFWRGC